jgi:energy-coupling factor transporter ATP-binding protein EcfA2
MDKSGIERCIADFTEAKFQCDEEFLRRFVAALTAKPFVILTGLSGSGKTKLAQAFAKWIAQPSNASGDVFSPGTVILSDRVSYYVRDSDRLSVELWNSEDEDNGKLVSLPRTLIRQWADFITENNLPPGTSARTIRTGVESTLKYSRQLNSFESPLRAAAFALLAGGASQAVERQVEVVAVGADWTSNEHVLGYPDGLDPKRYVRTKTLDLILNAAASPELPHFLILDEMNLSHVERYFADLLSAIESGEPIHLHGDNPEKVQDDVRSGIPSRLELPKNFFIIGTVNVDETTYLFSPKVLDRANVLEFRVSERSLREFLASPGGIADGLIEGKGSSHATGLMKLARAGHGLTQDELKCVNGEIMLFFKALQAVGGEMGFRVAKEIVAFIGNHKRLSGGGWTPRRALDAQVVQKILPKLHGSRNKLEPVLWSLATLCFNQRVAAADDHDERESELGAILQQAMVAMVMDDDSLDPLGTTATGEKNYPPDAAYLPLSFDKVVRMLNAVRLNGFTSFAEG